LSISIRLSFILISKTRAANSFALALIIVVIDQSLDILPEQALHKNTVLRKPAQESKNDISKEEKQEF
jgi:hypothetical protein